MHRLLVVLPAAAALLLAAHFYRAGSVPLAVLAALTIALLAVPRAWAARAMQGVLVVGAIEWLRTLAALSAARIAMEQPVLRMAMILLVVAAFTAACALVFRQHALRRWYRL